MHIFCFQNLNLPEGRIVFEVTLEGSARKLVTVRSSLILTNQLTETVEVKLENTLIHPGGNVRKWMLSH
jgi:vacuolar protein sorting-associated protein 13D